MRRNKAKEIMSVLREIPEVKSCSLYGSLAAGTDDVLSDIDIEIDVSGCDNGKFMLMLHDLLCEKIDIYYKDYAPSLVPENYIVSFALDENDPFLMVDICCKAEPHCTSVTLEQVAELNGKYTHMLKLWTANLKHYVRGSECRSDILRMAEKIGIGAKNKLSEAELLSEALCWLEANVENGLEVLTAACRRKFEELI